jgi:hypothetical protein
MIVGVRLPETRDMFSRRIEFPATRAEVVEAVGDEPIDSPSGDPETVAEVLGRSSTEEFAGEDDLYGVLVTHVGDAYIGRKYYDDRGAGGGDAEEVSF